MTPQEFLDTVILPTVEEAKAEPLSMRRTICAVALTDMLAAVIYDNRKSSQALVLVDGNKVHNDATYRKFLAERSAGFGLLHDIANAHKHVLLTKNGRKLTHASQVKAASLGYGMGNYGEGPFGGTEQIVVETDDGSVRNVLSLVDEVIEFLESVILQEPVQS